MIFERKIIKTGDSKALVIPTDIAKYMGFQEGTPIYLKAEEGKYGKYISFWRQDQSKECQED